MVVEIKEDVKEAVDKYPADPRPVTVDVRFAVLIPPPGPNAVEKEEKERETKLAVEIKEDVKEALEMYPIDPRPVTVESKLAELKNPAV